MNQQAFIVTAHQPEPILKRMVERLTPIGIVLVHVDARVPIEPFRDLIPSAILIPNRVKVTYPRWSLLEASLNLSRQALEIEGISRVTLLRSTHYPIVRDHQLAHLASDMADYIEALPAPNSGRGKPVSRFTRRSVSSHRHGRWGHVAIAGVINRLRPPLDWTVALGETELRAGSAYWSLRAETLANVVEIVRAGGPLVDYFSRIDSPDESFFHTVVPTISKNLITRPISYSSWEDGQHPTSLTREDLRSAMIEGTYFFAKKFEIELADWVDDQLSEIESEDGSLEPEAVSEPSSSSDASPSPRLPPTSAV